MLGAIVPNGDNGWYFKFLNDPSQVLPQKLTFRSWVESVKFDAGGKPTWTLPAGWQEESVDNGITYARLILDNGLQATVTMLPGRGGNEVQQWTSSVVADVNRWRGQVNLPPQEWEAMQESLEELPQLAQGGSKAYWVELSGTGNPSSSSGPPFMNMMGGAGASSGMPGSTSSASTPLAASSPSLKFETPATWEEIPASGMRLAAFNVSGDQPAEVTVIAAGGDIASNIGIWINQVEADQSPEYQQKVLEGAETLELQGNQVKVYTIHGSNSTLQSILVAEVPWKAEESLFVKLKGPTEIVDSQRENFKQYILSMNW